MFIIFFVGEWFFFNLFGSGRLEFVNVIVLVENFFIVCVIVN